MPRANVKDKRKQQLIEANIDSIARRGLLGTTIAHVSKGADMSRGIVNFYFTSKEKMMQETLTFLAEESTAAWRWALAEKRRETDSPAELLAALMRSLLGDRSCTAKRLSVWAAFLGQAGTYPTYARVVKAMDDALVQELRNLCRQSGFEPKAADERARQIQAAVRGHQMLGALGADSKKPSYYCDGWTSLLCGTEKKPSKTKAAGGKAKKLPAGDALAGQLDFGDLFARS